jgi:uncharacterized repeat protein (TIGR01451 family)
MKKELQSFIMIFCMLSITKHAEAQVGYIHSVAGCASCNASPADGIPAVMAAIGQSSGVYVDGAGNIYYGDAGTDKVRKVDVTTGLVYTIAGTGVEGFSGDGGPALSADLMNPLVGGIDAAGNLFIVDGGPSYPVYKFRIRKIDLSTGVINTVAGGGNSLADGIAAITAQINPTGLSVDVSGNIYLGDNSNNRIRKVDAQTGIINTIAGNGTGIESGDGGLAINAGIPAAYMGALDAAGNLFVTSDNGLVVRKIDAASGIISRVAGGGIGNNVDGSLATDATFGFINCLTVNGSGDIYLSDINGLAIRKVDAVSGKIYTVAMGNSNADWIPAIGAKGICKGICSDGGGNIYYADGAALVRKINGAISNASDSFSVSINHLCDGPQLVVHTLNYNAGLSVRTYFDNGPVVITPVINNNGAGYANIYHTYSATGIYTIKQVLYDGNNKIDSLQFLYENLFCNTISFNFYNDRNNNGIKDSGDIDILNPLLIEVDRNNVILDTISATSGLYYTAYGNFGDVYTFKLIAPPAGTHTSSPANGIITHILNPANITGVQAWGFSCDNNADFDLTADVMIPTTGRYEQAGSIYVRNNSCTPTDAVVTLNFSPKYAYNAGTVIPAATTASGNTMSWNASGLANTSAPLELYFAVWAPVGPLTIGDTVNESITITPIAGDGDPSNNIIIHEDTVKASCDPNLIEVTPKGNITAGTELKYKIEFENVGNDTAFNIYVLDTLPNELDARSLRIVSATHAMYVSPYNDGLHNIVKFDFPNINLLDSSHHDACTGTFTYTINTKTGLPDGTHIDHAAGIYFDANGLVETNTVENIIGWPANVTNVNNNSKVQVYPNPANNELNIQQQGTGYSSFTINNSIGQSVMQRPLTKEAKVNIKMLPAGVYYITLKGAKSSEVRKFVKM